MKKSLKSIFTLFCIIQIFHSLSIAQVNVYQHHYGDSLSEEFYSTYSTRDKAVIYTGYTTDVDSVQGVYIVKTDLLGNQTWGYGYQVNQAEIGYSIIESQVDTSTEYVVVGDCQVTDSNIDAFILRVDKNGNVISFNTFGTDDTDEHARSVIRVGSNYHIVGYTNDGSGNPYDILLYKTDLYGNLSDGDFIDINGRDDYGFDLVHFNDSLYITGNSVDTSGNSDVFLLKTDLNGNSQYASLYGDQSEDDYSYTINVKRDNFAMIGHTEGFGNNGAPHALVLNVDEGGSVNWFRTYDFGTEGDFGRDILVGDTTFYCIGSSYIDTSYNTNMTVFNIDDNNGDLIWVKSFGEDLNDFGYTGCLLSDGVIGAGTTFSFTSSPPDAYVIKTTKTGNEVCVDYIPDPIDSLIEIENWYPETSNENTPEFYNEEEVTRLSVGWDTICVDSAGMRVRHFVTEGKSTMENSILLYPNPSDGLVTLRFSDQPELTVYLEVVDLLGQVLVTRYFTAKEIGTYTSFDITDLPAGMYIVNIKVGNDLYSLKLFRR